MQSTRHFAAACLSLTIAAFLVSACGRNEAAPSADAKPNTQKSGAANTSDGQRPPSQGQSQGQGNAAGMSGAPQGGQPGRGGRQPPAVVITTTVREAPFSSEVEALGTAKANEAIDVTAKVSNRITAIRFREGQSVRAGDVLVELDADEAKADLAVAEASLDDSRNQVNRSRELFLTKALSAQQMDQLESTLRANEARVAASRARLNELTIRAPFAGRVGLRNVSVGSLVNSGTVITTLDDISVMKLDFSVPETFLSMLSEGLEIQASSAAYAGEIFKGRVLSIGSRVDAVSRSITVRAQVANREAKLKPGMFMTVRLMRSDNRALVIPEQALVPERDKQFVFAVRDGKAAKTEIVVGRRRPGEIEVLRGLQAGDVIVVEGTQKIREGVSVRTANAGVE